MKKSQLKSLLKQKISKKALEYLLSKRGSKGCEISYSNIQMANYLCPNESRLSISDKKEIFSIRNRMVNIFGNFHYKNYQTMCKEGCIQEETMEHIYYCEKMNNTENHIKYDGIYNNNLKNIIQIFNIMKENLKTRENIVNTSV